MKNSKSASVVTEVFRKTRLIRESGRSSDFIAPSFGHGCLLNCTYCYMKRHRPTGVSFADQESTGEILNAIIDHAQTLDIKLLKKFPKFRQTHENLITYDISCNEDIVLHWKHIYWEDIAVAFTLPRVPIMATMATKVIVPHELLDIIENAANYPTMEMKAPLKRFRFRVSLMPQEYSTLLEPNTPSIEDRIKQVKYLYDRGFDVHVNFSPVIFAEHWRYKYAELFMMIRDILGVNYASYLPGAEVIFLTHNKAKHQYNLDNNLSGEELIWTPDFQEEKISNNNEVNLRYKRQMKAKMVEVFKAIHHKYLPEQQIRYIF